MDHIKQGGQDTSGNSLGGSSLGLVAADLNPSKVSDLQLDAKHDTRCNVSSPQDLQVVPEVSLSPPDVSQNSNVIQNEDPKGQSIDGPHTKTRDASANVLALTHTGQIVGGCDPLTNECEKTENTSSKLLKRKVRTARPGAKPYREKVRGLCGRNKIQDILKDINDKNGFVNDSGKIKLFNNDNIRLFEKTAPIVHEKLEKQEISITDNPEQTTFAKTDPSDLVSVIDHSENNSENPSKRTLLGKIEGLSTNTNGNYLHQNKSGNGKVPSVNNEQAIYRICDQRSIECDSDHQSKDGNMQHFHLQKMETSPHVVAGTLADFVTQADQCTKNRETVDHKERTSVMAEPARKQDVRLHKCSEKLASFETSVSTCSVSDEQKTQYHDIVDLIKSNDQDIKLTKGQEKKDRVFGEVSDMSENQEIQLVMNAVVEQVCRVNSHVVTSETKVEEAKIKRGRGRPPQEKQKKSLTRSDDTTPEVEKVTDNSLQNIETSQTQVIYEDVIDDISNVVASPVCAVDKLNAAENTQMPVAEDSSVLNGEPKIEEAYNKRGRGRPPKVKQKKSLFDTADKTPKFEKGDNSLQNMEASQTPEISMDVTSDVSNVVVTPGCVVDGLNATKNIQTPVAEDSSVVTGETKSEKAHIKRGRGRPPKLKQNSSLFDTVDKTRKFEKVDNSLQNMEASQTPKISVDVTSDISNVVVTPDCVVDELNATKNFQTPVAEDSSVVTGETKSEKAHIKRGRGRPQKLKQNTSLFYTVDKTPEVEKGNKSLQIMETSQTPVISVDVTSDISNVVVTPDCVVDELNATKNFQTPVAEDSSFVTGETKSEKAHIKRSRGRPPKLKQKTSLFDTVDKTPEVEKGNKSLQIMETSQTPEISVDVTSDISTVAVTPKSVADKANTAEMPVAEDSAEILNVKGDCGRLPKEKEREGLLGFVDKTPEVHNVSNNNWQSMDMSQTASSRVNSHSTVKHDQQFKGKLSTGKEPSIGLADQLDKDNSIKTQIVDKINTSEYVQSNFGTESLPGITCSVTKRRGRPPKKKSKEQLLSTSVNTNLETDLDTCTPTPESTPVNLGLKELYQARSVKNMNKQTSSSGNSAEQKDSIERHVTDTDSDSDLKSLSPIISGERVNVENTDMLHVHSYQTTLPKSVTNLNQSQGINSTVIPNKTAFLSASDIILPFDNDPEETTSLSCSNYIHSETDLQTRADTKSTEILPASQPSCKKRSRRRSAEAFLDTSLIIASPSNDDAEVAILPQPSSFRRSKRIRRKSLELYKSHLLPIPGMQSEDDEIPCEKNIQEQENMQNSPSAESSLDMKDLACADNDVFTVDDGLQNTKDSAKCGQVPIVIITGENSSERNMEQSECSEDSPLDIVSNDQEVVPQEDKSITELLDTITESPIASEATDEKSEIESSAEKTTIKRGNRKQGKQKRGVKRKLEEPPLEDIYRNKLWRSQMPKPRGWETIFEEQPMGPHGDMGGGIYGNKKEKCLLSEEMFYTQARMKQRKTRAARRGYKAPTKRRHKALDKMLQSTLDKLDSDLAIA